MKFPFSVLFFVLSSIFGASVIAQNADVLSVAEKMPVYPGGNDSLLSHVMARVVYPQQCADSGIQGKVYVRFIVNEDGHISDVEAVKGPHPLLNKAAVEAVKTISKKFEPAIDNGKPVKVWLSVPVSFKAKVAEPMTEPKIDSIRKLTTVEVKPEFPGGDVQLMNFLRRNIQYPLYERDNNIDGQVLTRFLIDTNGIISDVQIIKGVSPGLDREAVRLVRSLPQFKPGMHDGRRVNVYFNLPVVFRLEDRHSSDEERESSLVFDYYPGGIDALLKQIDKNLNYPANKKNNKIEANIYVRCRFNNSLKLVPIGIDNSLDKEFDEEAFRIINLLQPFEDKIKLTDHIKSDVVIIVPFMLNTNGVDAARNDEYYNQGIKYFKAEKYTDALKQFGFAINNDPYDVDAFFNRGATKLKLNDNAGACDDFKRAYLLGELDAMKGIKEACK